ncbi:MAG: hypothetical protein ACE5EM_11875 [Sphingomonadales bacterium]
MTDRLIGKIGNHNTIQILTTVVVACLLLAGPIRAQPPQPAPRLTSDSDIASAGFFRLLWETDAERVELQESKHATFENARILYQGSDRATVVSGKPDGTWYYRIRAIGKGQAGPWSKAVVVTVDHHSLTRAIGFFVLGLIVFIGILFVIVGGARQAAKKETGP